MKILIVRTFPDILQLNNYNVQEIGLAKALNVKGCQCDIVLWGGKEKNHCQEYSYSKDGKNYKFKIFWLKGYSFLKNGLMPSVYKLINQYEVIQVHEYDQLQSYFIYRFINKPVVIYHGPYYDSYAKGYNLKCKVFDLLFLHGKKYKKIVAMTKSILAKEFLLTKGFKKTQSIGVGLDTDKFQGNDSAQLLGKPEKGVLRLLYVGKIESRRNVYFMIEVFRELIATDIKLQLVIVGQGEKEYQNEFLGSISKEIENKTILYLPSANQIQLKQIYLSANLFLFTSNYEIFGMVLLEAMYFGLPVVSSRNGGALTLINHGENGFILDEFERSQWVMLLKEILTNPEHLKEIGYNASKTIKEHYLWEALSEKFISEYELAVSEWTREQM